MKKLIQNRLHSETVKGNCFPTVIACFMDKDSPEDVLQIQEHYNNDDWVTELTDWLNENGWEWLSVNDHLDTEEFYLVTGLTERSTITSPTKHVCIYQKGKLWHDPHPSQSGLTTEEHFETLTKI